MANILIVVLLNGREILGDLQIDKLDAANPRLILKDPTEISVAHNPKTGAVDVHMAPLTPLGSEKEIELAPAAIAYTYQPVPEVRQKFNNMFGSGLITPEPGKIIKP